MLKSESLAALMPALLVAQKQIKGALKDTTNPHLKSKYADLGSVFDACKQALNDAGLVIVQATDQHDLLSVTVGTFIYHGSGEFIGCRLNLVPVKQDPQGIGSCITYARRYTLSTLVGVCPEDDDGHSASQRPAPILTSGYAQIQGLQQTPITSFTSFGTTATYAGGDVIHAGKEAIITAAPVPPEPKRETVKAPRPSRLTVKQRYDAAYEAMCEKYTMAATEAFIAEIKEKHATTDARIQAMEQMLQKETK